MKLISCAECLWNECLNLGDYRITWKMKEWLGHKTLQIEAVAIRIIISELVKV